MHTNAYKGGGGGLNMTKNTHFVRMLIENATLSETFNNLFARIPAGNFEGKWMNF